MIEYDETENRRLKALGAAVPGFNAMFSPKLRGKTVIEKSEHS